MLFIAVCNTKDLAFNLVAVVIWLLFGNSDISDKYIAKCTRFAIQWYLG